MPSFFDLSMELRVMVYNHLFNISNMKTKFKFAFWCTPRSTTAATARDWRTRPPCNPQCGQRNSRDVFCRRCTGRLREQSWQWRLRTEADEALDGWQDSYRSIPFLAGDHPWFSWPGTTFTRVQVLQQADKTSHAILLANKQCYDEALEPYYNAREIMYSCDSENYWGFLELVEELLVRQPSYFRHRIRHLTIEGDKLLLKSTFPYRDFFDLCFPELEILAFDECDSIHTAAVDKLVTASNVLSLLEEKNDYQGSYKVKLRSLKGLRKEKWPDATLIWRFNIIDQEWLRDWNDMRSAKRFVWRNEGGQDSLEEVCF